MASLSESSGINNVGDTFVQSVVDPITNTFSNTGTGWFNQDRSWLSRRTLNLSRCKTSSRGSCATLTGSSSRPRLQCLCSRRKVFGKIVYVCQLFHRLHTALLHLTKDYISNLFLTSHKELFSSNHFLVCRCNLYHSTYST